MQYGPRPTRRTPPTINYGGGLGTGRSRRTDEPRRRIPRNEGGGLGTDSSSSRVPTPRPSSNGRPYSSGVQTPKNVLAYLQAIGRADDRMSRAGRP